VTAGGVHDLLRAAVELLPEITELELTETVAGLRPGSPDNAPLIGPTGLDGLLIASGHYRNGILLVPVTAEGVATILAGNPVPDLIAPFSPTRFAPPMAVAPTAHQTEAAAQGGVAGAPHGAHAGSAPARGGPSPDAPDPGGPVDRGAGPGPGRGGPRVGTGGGLA
jgi:hypothetical protein